MSKRQKAQRNDSLDRKSVLIKPRSNNQKEFFRAVAEKDFIFCSGGPGSGKTYLSIGIFCQMLVTEKLEKIVLIQHTKNISKNMGFAPGNFKSKCLDYLPQQVAYFEEFLGPKKFMDLWKANIIEIVAIELVRGRNFKNTGIILEEAQMCSKHDLLTFISRVAKGSKTIVIGDKWQSEFPDTCVFGRVIESFEDEAVAKIEFSEEDAFRHQDMSRIYHKIMRL